MGSPEDKAHAVMTKKQEPHQMLISAECGWESHIWGYMECHGLSMRFLFFGMALGRLGLCQNEDRDWSVQEADMTATLCPRCPGYWKNEGMGLNMGKPSQALSLCLDQTECWQATLAGCGFLFVHIG
jgi:hypothetical protein